MVDRLLLRRCCRMGRTAACTALDLERWSRKSHAAATETASSASAMRRCLAEESERHYSGRVQLHPTDGRAGTGIAQRAVLVALDA